MNPVIDLRGSVSLMTAFLAPVLIMMLALAVEVTSWSLSTVELQRIADIAAWTGAQNYAGTNDAQAATGAAVDLAELNGVDSAASRTWDVNAQTTTDNLTKAQIVSGIRDASEQAIKVSVSRIMTKSFANIFPSVSPSITLTATSIAEVTVARLPTCAVALSRTGGKSAAIIAMSSSAKIVAKGCSVRSNGSIVMSGSSIIDVTEVAAAGSISNSDSSYYAGKTTLNAAATGDPLASFGPLQNALAALPRPGPTVVLAGSAGLTIDPGDYASIDVSDSAILTLNPGLYNVSGHVNVSGSAQIAGNQVTIISNGALTVAGSAVIQAKQPDATSKAGGITGILFASKSTLASSISGSATVPAGGTFYYPNSDFSLNGSVAAGTLGCTLFITSTFAMTGSASVTTDCTPSGGAPAVSRLPTIAFVQ